MGVKVSELASDLKPYVLGWLKDVGVGGGGIEGGVLGTYNYPLALLRDGSRSLTGNLTVEEGVVIDGVDLSVLNVDFQSLSLNYGAHIANEDAHHAAFVGFTTDDGQSADPWELDDRITLTGGTGLQTSTDADRVTIELGLKGGLQGDGEGIWINGTAGLVVDADSVWVGSGNGITVDAAAVHVNEHYAFNWTNEHAFHGNMRTSHVAPIFTDTYDLGTPTKLWRKGWLSELDAVLFAENTISVVGGWMMIAKNQGTLVVDAAAGNTTMDLGTTTLEPGDIVVFRSSLKVEYVRIEAQYLLPGPVAGYRTHNRYRSKTSYRGLASAGASTVYDVTRNVDGSGANDWVAGSVWVALGQNGDGRIELYANGGDPPRLSMIRQGTAYNLQTEMLRIGDLSGSWGYVGETYGVAIGEWGSGKPNITVDPTNGLRIRSYTSDIFTFGTDGTANISGVLNLQTGGGIYQGVGTFADPWSGLKIHQSGGIGRIATYKDGYLELALDTDGKLRSGNGGLTFDRNGLRADVTLQHAAFDWYRGTTPVGRVFADYASWGGTPTLTLSKYMNDSPSFQNMPSGIRLRAIPPLEVTDSFYGAEINVYSGDNRSTPVPSKPHALIEFSLGVGLINQKMMLTLKRDANSGQRTAIFGDCEVGMGMQGNVPTYILQLGVDSAAKPGTSTWTVTSDARTKKNVRPYQGGLSVLEKLSPVSFQYNGLGGTPVDDDREFVGLTAQEVQPVLPNAVKANRRRLRPDDETETDVLDFNPNDLIYVLVNAVKELSTRLKSAEARIPVNPGGPA